MSNLWDSVRKHTRRWSSGVTKLQLGGLPDEHSTQPIRVQLGDEIMIYEKNQWHRDTENKQMLDLNERNRMLEGENQVLHFKVNVLLDMLASSTLDAVQLKQASHKQNLR
ncbi:hypothetical protein BASA50_002743 [Batrachochytrium salamandrivorans]|uniref:Uncharacterized protein n=1 Tax=Batrachochytrium salamandrivorans TaxID=1357716 RepID=A0ABQ8FKF6_9FUNG|nr:hypothetical protein BASA62_008438 [Batrachochytrium salamandrivorans]KAH6563673.1 hypothetical protein BASA62_008388 [Batrachochytrium salamandrivorans]KAH6571357.1 hypothetical protein BASA60_007186 [Batrachochytrium salamandrivorans]KAH6596312.1 hypothetical protein BASA61_003545 [Batrachochytrium salamandrivorans]KAH6599812.1 hypothetical protein BASA50_002743 [Batrachochytrium salamandrivorans]